MTPRLLLAALLLATTAAHATDRPLATLAVEPGAFHPDLTLVLLPATAADETWAARAGLPLGPTTAGDTVGVYPSRSHGLEPSPFADTRRVDLLTPTEMYGISGIP